MSTTVQYKGSTITTISGETKKLNTRGTWLEDDITITATPESENGSVYQDEEGYVVLDDEPGVNVSVTSLSVTSNGTYTAPTGVAYSPVTVSVPATIPSLQSKTKSYTPSETAQSETVTADSGYDGLSEVSVSVGAISSTYVGSGIARKSSSDLTVSGATITAPAGYYSSSASKAVATATHPNPTASINSSTGVVTASHTQTTGYVTGGTTTGTLSLTTQAAKTVTPSTASQTAVAAGRYTTGSVIVSAMPTGTLKTPTLSLNSATGIVTASAGISSAGYLTATASASNTLQLTTKGATTYTPGSVAQTIAAGTYLTGTQTVEAIPSAYIIPSGTLNISSAGTYDVTNYASAEVSVSGGVGNIVPLIVTPQNIEQVFNAGTQEETIATKSDHDGNSNVTWTIDLASSFSSGDTFRIAGRMGRENSGVPYQQVDVDESFSWDGQSHTFTYTTYGTYALTVSTNQIVITGGGTNYSLTVSKVTEVDGYAPVTVEAVAGGVITADQIAERAIVGAVSGSALTIYGNAFSNNTQITEASFPLASDIGIYAFANCYALSKISFPTATAIGTGAFASCRALTTVELPSAKTIQSSSFGSCAELTMASFPHATFIYGSAFYRCFNLLSLYLLGSSRVNLTTATAFYSTPISTYTTSTGGVYGSVFVPASLYDAYISASYWSTYSTRIVSLTDAEIAALG